MFDIIKYNDIYYISYNIKVGFMKNRYFIVLFCFILLFSVCSTSSELETDKIKANHSPMREDKIKIMVIIENYSIDRMYKSGQGLSLLIEHKGNNILLDVGPNNNFITNAEKMNIDLDKVNYLFLSHNHMDHTRGINGFFGINNIAQAYLMDNIDSKYYLKLLFINIPAGLSINRKYTSRINQIGDDLLIENNIYFLRNSFSEYEKTSLNNKLFKRVGKSIINDTFDHEAILVIEENNELVIFSPCSHNGILNIIETVKIKIPDKRIGAFIGGLHLWDPFPGANVSIDYLDYLINELKDLDITIYTGHCTGTYAFNYMQKYLGEKIQEISTGMILYL